VTTEALWGWMSDEELRMSMNAHLTAGDDESLRIASWMSAELDRRALRLSDG
jgi:hypothetical protein